MSGPVITGQEAGILLLTFKVAMAGVVCSLPLGIAAAWLLSRRAFFGRTLLDGVIHLPLVLPPVVVGYLLLLALAPAAPLSAWLQSTFGLSFAFRWTGAALASAIMGFPLMVRSIRQALEAVDSRLEFAARTLGRSRLEVFLTVTLPLTMPGIITGMILSFARSLGEFGATITFVSNIPGETETLPIAIYSLLQQPGSDGAVMRLSLFAIALSLLALLASDRIARMWRP